MADLLTGAGLGGVLGLAFAGLALLTTLRDEPTEDPRVRSIRLLSRAFMGGAATLGLVVIVLSLAFGGTSSSLAGLVGGIGIGVGAFGVRRVALDFERAVRTEDPVRARARAVLGMAMAQGVTVISAVGLILAVELFST